MIVLLLLETSVAYRKVLALYAADHEMRLELVIAAAALLGIIIEVGHRWFLLYALLAVKKGV